MSAYDNPDDPAFPIPLDCDFDGMQLRDYFAAKALQGLYAAGKANEHVSDTMLAGWAYSMADAMLAERAK